MFAMYCTGYDPKKLKRIMWLLPRACGASSLRDWRLPRVAHSAGGWLALCLTACLLPPFSPYHPTPFPPLHCLSGSTQVSLVAHSAGGWLARLYLAEYGHADVALLLSLGSPHLPPPPGAEGVVDQTRGLLTHMQAVSPGAFHAPHVKYVCISGSEVPTDYMLCSSPPPQLSTHPLTHSSRYIKGLPLFGSAAATPAADAAASAPASMAAVAAAAGGEARVFALDVKPVRGASAKAGSESESEEGSSGASDEDEAGAEKQVASGGGVFQARMVGQGYKQVCGRAEVWGDGVVPEDAALLEGAENLILDGVYHSPVGASEARPWYGSPSVLPSWQHHLLA
ncbi:unnamed protein product [Closterium sp. Naga37s-1]|nr:unnamed protein product [Closterium sp. Naga37s-1]